MSRFVEVFGRGSAYSMPEAHQALANGVFELVVCPVANGDRRIGAPDCR